MKIHINRKRTVEKILFWRRKFSETTEMIRGLEKVQNYKEPIIHSVEIKNEHGEIVAAAKANSEGVLILLGDISILERASRKLAESVWK